MPASRRHRRRRFLVSIKTQSDLWNGKHFLFTSFHSFVCSSDFHCCSASKTHFPHFLQTKTILMNGFHRVLLCIWMVCNHIHLCKTSIPNKMRTKVMVYFKNILWATFFLIMSTQTEEKDEEKEKGTSREKVSEKERCGSVRREKIHSVENLFVVWNGKCWTKWKYIIATRKTENVWIFLKLFSTFHTFRFLSLFRSFLRSSLIFAAQIKCVIENLCLGGYCWLEAKSDGES